MSWYILSGKVMLECRFTWSSPLGKRSESLPQNHWGLNFNWMELEHCRVDSLDHLDLAQFVTMHTMHTMHELCSKKCSSTFPYFSLLKLNMAECLGRWDDDQKVCLSWLGLWQQSTAWQKDAKSAQLWEAKQQGLGRVSESSLKTW